MTGKAQHAMLAADTASDGLNAVRLLERRRIEATRTNDVAALAPLLHDQLIYVNSAGEMYDKKHYLHGIGTHALTYDKDFDVRETHARAASSDSNGLSGNVGRYFRVRKSDSENGLSSETLGRLKLGTTPSSWSVASSVLPFIGAPLSE